MNYSDALRKTSHRTLVLSLILMMSGCGQSSAPIYDLAGKQLPDKGSEGVVAGHDGESVYVANNEETYQDSTKLADIPRNQIEAAEKKALNGDSEGWNAFIKQSGETEAQHLISAGRMFKLADGTHVQVLEYYKNVGVAPQDRLIPLNPDDKQEAWAAKIQVVAGEHKGQAGIIFPGQLSSGQ